MTRCSCERAGLPEGKACCVLCELDHTHGVPVPDRAVWADVRDRVATFRPPADQRCPGCDRILLSAPCDCRTPVQRAFAARLHADALDDALTSPERIALRRLLREAKAAPSPAPGDAR